MLLQQHYELLTKLEPLGVVFDSLIESIQFIFARLESLSEGQKVALKSIAVNDGSRDGDLLFFGLVLEIVA